MSDDEVCSGAYPSRAHVWGGEVKGHIDVFEDHLGSGREVAQLASGILQDRDRITGVDGAVLVEVEALMQRLLVALAGYAAYVINAGQFLWKLRMARLEGAMSPQAVTA